MELRLLEIKVLKGGGLIVRENKNQQGQVPKVLTLYQVISTTFQKRGS